MIKRWIANRAFRALCWFMDTHSLPNSQYNECVAALDVLRKYMYKD